MTIEIQRPELEALLLERMQKGSFASIEDVLMEALESSPLPQSAEPGLGTHTGAALVAAMQTSPYKELVLEPSRSPMPVRGLAF